MWNFELKLFLTLSSLCVVLVEFVHSSCILSYPNDIKISPIYSKTLGNFSLVFPYNGIGLELNHGETIKGFCPTSFSPISHEPERNNHYRYMDYPPNILIDQKLINISCTHNTLFVNNHILTETVLKCKELNWSVYDTIDTYEWCEKNENFKTFLLATKSNKSHHTLAGICFNVKDWFLQTITYNITSNDHSIQYNIELQRDITKTQLKAFQALGEDLQSLRTNHFDLDEKDLQQQLAKYAETNPWLKLATYEISPITQGDSYQSYFAEFSNILNIVWWRNLRLGNWKLFMTTLETYAYNNSFQVFTGTSGIVRVPAKNAVDILEIKNNYFNKTVPGYIWSYLTATDNRNEDFIIVGYNSPFPEWFGMNDVIFCPNICSEIPWLKEINSSFGYTTAGIMFCCSPDFIRQTNNLDGFPMDVLIERAKRKQTNLLEIENSSENLLNSDEMDTTMQNLILDDGFLSET